MTPTRSLTSKWITAATLRAIQQRWYLQSEIRDELLTKIVWRITTMNPLFPHTPTNPNYCVHEDGSFKGRTYHHLSLRRSASRQQSFILHCILIQYLSNHFIKIWIPNSSDPPKQLIELENERRDITTTSTSARAVINNYSSERESGSTLPEQWELTRMRRRNNMRNRADANMIRGTHPVVTDSQSVDIHVPTSIDVIQLSDRISTTIHLTPIEKTFIEAQNNIGWEHFIRSRTGNPTIPH